MSQSALDPITLEIVWNGLKSINDESWITIQKSAFSTNIKERHDHSTAIADAHGRLIAQAEMSLPIHLASLLDLMRILVARYGDDIAEGDLFIANDPHVAGGTHLPDINMAMPVFADGRLVAFVSNLAHHADVGGAARGSMSGGMSEIYQEGLRIPVMRLYRRGELDTELFDLLLLNMRLPAERRGDLNAQIAACRLGVERMRQLLARYGTATVEGAFGQILERTARRMRAGIAAIPDGSYRFEDVLDDDGLKERNVKFALEVRKAGERIVFDFTGLLAAGARQRQPDAQRGAVLRVLRAEGAARSGAAEQSGRHRRGGDRGPSRLRRQLRGARRGGAAGQHLPARHRRRHRRAGRRAARAGHRRRQRRQHQHGVRRHRPAQRRALRLSRDARRRHGRTQRPRRQGRRAGAYHQHLESARRGDRDGIPAACRGVRAGGQLRRRGPLSRRHGAAAQRAPRRPHLRVQRRGRALPTGAVGHLRRRAGAQRALPAAAPGRDRVAAAAEDRAHGAQARPDGNRGDPWRRRLWRSRGARRRRRGARPAVGKFSADYLRRHYGGGEPEPD